MKLLRSTKFKITKNENGENGPCLETTEVVLIPLMKVINKIQEFCIHLFLINHLVDVWFTDQNSKALELEDRRQ